VFDKLHSLSGSAKFLNECNGLLTSKPNRIYTPHMPVARKTHDFPYGKPLALLLAEIAFIAAFLVWGFLGGVSRGWRGYATLVALLISIQFLYSKLIGTYERNGRAVPIKRSRVRVRYPSGLPALMLAVRLSFFAAVAIMLFMGLGPVPESIAKIGIIGCVFGLVAVAGLSIALERYYVSRGRAIEVDVSAQSGGNGA